MNNLEERIIDVMGAVFELSNDEIDINSSPDTIKEWDSLKHMNLIIALEEEFNIEFDDSVIGNLINFALIKVHIEEVLQ
jgi:acyl carrier protein